MDMELVGYPFTWERGKGTERWVEIRLDRVLITQSWRSCFPYAILENYEITVSDHCPILVHLSKQQNNQGARRFRFENAWTREPMCRQIIKDSWGLNYAEPMQIKIKCCSTSLAEWGRNITGNFKDSIADCNKVMRRLKYRRDAGSIARFKAAQDKLFEVLAKKEMFWRQRSKELWLQAGDQNTRYFHACASSRRRRNQFSRLKNAEGNWVDWETGLAEVIEGYYRELFTESNISCSRVIGCIDKGISRDQNEMLLESVTTKEVKQALFQMNPDKSPGPDGFNPGFYQKYWDIVGSDVVQMVTQIFDTGEFPLHLAETHICLIPKKLQPEIVGDLRPIALCNVIYKVVSKVIANRMKKVLPSVISDTQSAFLPGRLITDNIMVSFEIMHYLKRRTKGKEGYMAVKLDMSKAYDRIEWNFLRAVLGKMGFAERLINLVMNCVNKVSYKILVGGKEIGPIIPGRGLRQGDPLSPYLFIICAEGFSSLIRDFERSGMIQGCKISRGAPLITHMLFADDSYVYCKANVEGANNLVDLLNLFQQASGQQVNLNKSSVFFSPNTAEAVKQEVCSIL